MFAIIETSFGFAHDSGDVHVSRQTRNFACAPTSGHFAGSFFGTIIIS